MYRAGDIISYIDMCQEEGAALQRGMNFRLRGNISVILMSLRRNAPYADRIENDGKILIYEGHDCPRTSDNPVPKLVNQPMTNPKGSLSQNGRFFKAAEEFKTKICSSEKVKVYEKIHTGIWSYNGLFHLTDAWQESDGHRNVFKFRLELSDTNEKFKIHPQVQEDTRLIPSSVKLEVWKRDKGKCVLCGSNSNLHFDHIIPYSKGGSSLVADNIQLLCATHNLAKRDKIE